MPSRRHRNLITALVVLLVLGLLGALVGSGTLTLRQRRVPAIPLRPALATLGDDTSISTIRLVNRSSPFGLPITKRRPHPRRMNPPAPASA